MRRERFSVLTFLSIVALHVSLLQADTPAPKNIIHARIPGWYDPAKRCPDLRQADPEESKVAVVLLHVGPTGVPSQPAVQLSSGSADLDQAALACVMKLRFLPATSAGDGTPVESWQQIAFKRAPTPAGATAPTAASAPAAVAAGAVAAGPAAAAGAATPSGAGVRDASAETRVCADASGKLTQDPAITRSSGDAAFDAAALAVARAGSGHYRPGTGADGKPAAGCVQLTIKSPGP